MPKQTMHGLEQRLNFRMAESSENGLKSKSRLDYYQSVLCTAKCDSGRITKTDWHFVNVHI